MNSSPTIPLLDQVAADCLRGMLADQYFKPDVKRDGALQAWADAAHEWAHVMIDARTTS